MSTREYQGSTTFMESKIRVIFGTTTVKSTPMMTVPITIIAAG